MKQVIKTAENCEEEIHAMAYVILHCAARFGNTGNSEADRWNIQLGLNIMQGDTHGRGRPRVDMSTKKCMYVRLWQMNVVVILLPVWYLNVISAAYSLNTVKERNQ